LKITFTEKDTEDVGFVTNTFPRGAGHLLNRIEVDDENKDRPGYVRVLAWGMSFDGEGVGDEESCGFLIPRHMVSMLIAALQQALLIAGDKP